MIPDLDWGEKPEVPSGLPSYRMLYSTFTCEYKKGKHMLRQYDLSINALNTRIMEKIHKTNGARLLLLQHKKSEQFGAIKRITVLSDFEIDFGYLLPKLPKRKEQRQKSYNFDFDDDY